MGIPRFIKLPRNTRFHYEPRYWDPEKEAREDRIRSIKQELGIEVPGSANKTTLKRGSFRQAKKQAKVKASRASNIRLLIILAALFAIAYLLFYA